MRKLRPSSPSTLQCGYDRVEEDLRLQRRFNPEKKLRHKFHFPTDLQHTSQGGDPPGFRWSEKEVEVDAASLRMPTAPQEVLLKTKERHFNNVHLSPSTKTIDSQ